MKKIYTLLATLIFIAANAQLGVDCQIPTGELIINGANDVKVTIEADGTTASSYEPHQPINLSFDGDVETHYHSAWGGNTVFPVILNYRFDGSTSIDYLKYVPRKSGSNGLFGKVTISYNTISNSEFEMLTTYNFGQSSNPAFVYFPHEITPLNIQISVEDGRGGSASCAEMEFYQSAANNPNPYTHIFADDLYSQLQSTVTQADIDAITSPFYKSLAQCLFDGTYNLKYRVQDYEVYPTLEKTETELKVSGYNYYENPTGIVVAANEKLVLFAKNIPSEAAVYLLTEDFEAGFFGAGTSFYQIKNGINVFNAENKGLAYISYYSDDETLEDVQINFVNGKVNGVFHYEKSLNSEWADLLSTPEIYPKIDIVGEFTHLVYEKTPMLQENPDNGLGLIAKYDEINRHERMLMGLFKYNKSPKNRILSYSGYGGGWNGGGWGVHLDINWGASDLFNIDKMSLWGIPHEFGHINQIRPDLKWVGTTEVTVNIYTAWVNYNMNPEGNKYTRLESDSKVPYPGAPEIVGGTFNGFINNTTVNGEAWQETYEYDLFKVLIPFWQLQLYYQLAGASRGAPTLSFDYPPPGYNGIDYARWFGTVAEVSRNTNSEDMTDGELLLQFVKNTCDAVEEDLTDFFTTTGFLRPIDQEVGGQRGSYGHLTVTQAQIDSVVAYIQSKNYEKPISPVIHYISSHSVEMFKNKLPLSGRTGYGVDLNGTDLTVQHSEWKNAVAYEVYNASNELILVSITGSGNIENTFTKVYYPSNALAVYAVGYNGQKKLVYPYSTQPFCVKPGTPGTPGGFTKVGILTKGKITNTVGGTSWPENVPNGHIVLDSENKGFVITHMTTAERDALTPLNGMLIYNTTLNCVQLYRGTAPEVDPARTGWQCIERGCNEEVSTYPQDYVHCGNVVTKVIDMVSPVTGKIWMDRNLGASMNTDEAAAAGTPEEAYGDLYQWGRYADGHQCRNSLVTSTLSSTDTHGNGDFIVASNSPYDWRSPQNDNLWQGNGLNNPCPTGYRLPTWAEWEAENIIDADDAFIKLGLTLAGGRNHTDGSPHAVTMGVYWSSTGVGSGQTLTLSGGGMYTWNEYRAFGLTVRCIKN